MQKRSSGRRLTVTLLLLPGLSAAGNDYEQQHAAAVRACEAINPDEYQSGLYFNPDGYRSYYVQSQCIQKAAILFRDSKLCAEVRQRRALFSSSWGYSKSNCRKMVKEEIARDREEIVRMKKDYEQGHMRLSDFRIERNGNGRDFDIIPEFTGTGAHGYKLVFEIIQEDSGLSPVLLDASGFYLEGETTNIRIYVPQREIRKRFPEFSLDEPWPVRASLVYSVGIGSHKRKWSNAFIESVFPVSARTQTMVKEMRF